MKDRDDESRSVLADVIARFHRKTGKTREELVTQFNAALGRDIKGECGELLRRPITVSMLNEFTRTLQPGREAQFPASWLPVLYSVTGDDSLTRFLLPERHRALLVIGERVLHSRDELRRADEELTKLVESSPKKKEKGK